MESIASNKTSFHSLSLAALALTSLQAVQQTAAQKQNESPRIEKRASDEVLRLPGRLNESIRAQFPGFRVPAAKDRTGLWESDTDEGNLPFAVWGDFNGDGRTDVALILLGDEECKFVIFHQMADGYSVAHVVGGKTGNTPNDWISSPQILSLKLIPKGKIYTYSGSRKLRYSFKTEAIEFSASEQFLSLLHWKDGKYETIEFGD
jgi:hypothetical protein